MSTSSLAPTHTPDLLPGFWIETPQRQALPQRRTHIASRWWERLIGRTRYEIITSPAGYGLFYTELRIRYLRRNGLVHWSIRDRRYAALCGGAAGVVRFLTELRNQGLPIMKARIDVARQTVHGSSALERWPGPVLDPVRS